MSNFDARIPRVYGSTYRKGAVVPPIGTDLTVFQDTDGTMKQIDKNGTKTPIGGSSGAGWAATKLARAQAANVLLDGYFYSDFATNADLALGPLNAAGTLTYADSTHAAQSPSCAQLDATGAQVAHATLPGNAALTGNLKTTVWYMAWRAKFPNAPDATDNVHLELRVPGGSPVLIGIRGATSTAKWCLSIANVDIIVGAGATSNIDQLVHDFEVWFDGTNIVAAVDGTTIATTAVLTNVPTAGGCPSLVVQGVDSAQKLIVDKLLAAFPTLS